jgi:Predicted integral membrane protein
MELKRSDLKSKAKELIKNKYWDGVFAGLILAICATDSFLFSNNSGVTYQSSDPTALFPKPSELLQFITSSSFFYGATFVLFMTFFFSVFIGNPMQYGARNWFKKHGEEKDQEEAVLFSGFRKKQWVRVSACILWRDLICICWGLLLIFPGIMKSYEYKFVPYILEEHPMMNAADVLKYSSNLTKGHKMELFKLDLSFIGWFLLQLVTFDLVGFFYAGPYFYQTQALAYLQIKNAIADTRKAEGKKTRKNR